jgi:hypothetical protein
MTSAVHNNVFTDFLLPTKKRKYSLHEYDEERCAKRLERDLSLLSLNSAVPKIQKTFDDFSGMEGVESCCKHKVIITDLEREIAECEAEEEDKRKDANLQPFFSLTHPPLTPALPSIPQNQLILWKPNPYQPQPQQEHFKNFIEID